MSCREVPLVVARLWPAFAVEVLKDEMSDNVLSVISDDPSWTPASSTAEQATSIFRQLFPDAGDVAAESFGGVQFVDQGGNFDTVACPSCAATLDRAWWSERMDAAYCAETRCFDDLAVVMPCCGIQSSLNDLTYSWPAGFASFALVARNPGRSWLRPDELAKLSETLGCDVRQVLAHY
jgi:hypothetical protein